MNILVLHFFMFLLFSLLLLVIFKSQLSKKIYTIIISVQCTIIVGFRDVSVGIDTMRYEAHFYKTIENIDYIWDQGDKGYFLFQKIFGSIFYSDFNLWLLFVSAVVYTLLGITIYKHSKNIFLSYLLYFSLEFFLFDFSGIRQSLALSIIFISYIYIYNEKPFKFLITTLFAATIHASAIVFIPAYWIARKEITKRYLVNVFLLITFIFIFRNQIGTLLLRLYYSKNELKTGLNESSEVIGGTSIAILLVILLSITLIHSKKFIENNLEYKFLTNLIIVSMVIQLMSSFSYLFTRLNHYYLIFIILYLPYVIFNLGKGRVNFTKEGNLLIKYIIYLSIYLMFSSYYFYKIIKSIDAVLPYSFYWD